MTPRTRRPPLTAATVTAATLLGLAAPFAPYAAASEAGGVPGSPDTTRPHDAVTLTPASGTAGTTVTVRARCASSARAADGDGAVFSPAFVQAAALRPAPDGGMVAEATVQRGLAPGRAYVVTANCSATESLTTTFVHTHAGGQAAVAVELPADAQPPGLRQSEQRVQSEQTVHTAQTVQQDANRVDGVALAFGGGLAGAALAGYLLTVRRTASRRRARAAAYRTRSGTGRQ